MTYREAFRSEAEAVAFTDTLVHGGIIQRYGDIWHVWQING